MFSGIRKLGEAQDMAEDIVQDIDEGNDLDFIGVNYLSPDSGYPPQRIENYDEQLVQHQTLNGVGQSRLPATFFPGKFMNIMKAVRERTTPVGVPLTGRSAKALMPRYTDLMKLRETATSKPVPTTPYGFARRVQQAIVHRPQPVVHKPQAVTPTWLQRLFGGGLIAR